MKSSSALIATLLIFELAISFAAADHPRGEGRSGSSAGPYPRAEDSGSHAVHPRRPENSAEGHSHNSASGLHPAGRDSSDMSVGGSRNRMPPPHHGSGSSGSSWDHHAPPHHRGQSSADDFSGHDHHELGSESNSRPHHRPDPRGSNSVGRADSSSRSHPPHAPSAAASSLDGRKSSRSRPHERPSASKGQHPSSGLSDSSAPMHHAAQHGADPADGRASPRHHDENTHANTTVVVVSAVVGGVVLLALSAALALFVYRRRVVRRGDGENTDGASPVPRAAFEVVVPPVVTAISVVDAKNASVNNNNGEPTAMFDIPLGSVVVEIEETDDACGHPVK